MAILTIAVYAGPPGINMPGGRIAITHDGNQHDLDDIGALPMNGALLWASGLMGRLVHLEHSNHLGNNSSSQEAKMVASASGSVSRFGVPANRVFNAQSQLSASIANFKAEAEKSTSADPLWFICSGPMETAWRCINAVNSTKRKYIHCISHSSWNEKHADTSQLNHTWADMKSDFPTVTFHDIVDQNGSDGDNDWNTPLSKWYWLRDSSYEPYRWLYGRNQFSTKYDPSDAGMTYWLISGGPNGGDQRAGWPEAKALLEWKLGSGQNQAPTATFTTPTNGQAYTAPATINLVDVAATDSDGSIANVKLYLDGALVRQENLAPYQWNPTQDPGLVNLAAGNYTLRAVATDNQGATGEATITVTVQGPNTPPSVSFASPSNGDSINEGDPLTVVANASDSDGSVANVKLYLDGAFVRQENSAPYEWSDAVLQSLSAGSHTLKATAIDNVGATANKTITINVVGNTTTYLPVPGRIEAEDYRNGGEGVGYHDTTAGNSGGAYRTDNVDIQATGDAGGGFNVGWVAAAEWLAYNVDVAAAGMYKVTCRVASAQTTNKTMHIEVDGANVTGAITFNTGGAGWQAYQDEVAASVSLPAGKHTLKIVMDSSNFNVNYVDIEAENSIPTVIAAINCGGPAYTAADGVQYQADGMVSGGKTYSKSNAIAGTVDDKLYQSERYGNCTYSIPVANGSYEVTLRMAEIYWNAAGKRVFDVKIEGQVKVNDMDLYATAGKNVAVNRTFTVDVTDGVLNIQTVTVVNNAKLSAILVKGGSAPANNPPVIESEAWADPAAIQLGGSTMLSVFANDADGDNLTYSWSKKSGPGTVSFDSANQDTSSASFSAAGDYVLKVTVSDGKASVSSECSVTVSAVSTNPTVTITDDAYLQGTKRYNDAYMKVEPGYRVSYIKLNAQDSSGISSVKLRMTVNGDPGSGTIRLYKGSSSNWTETTLSSTNAPSVGAQLASRSGTWADGTTYEFDITSLITGDGAHTIVIKMDSGGNDAWFGSTESTTKPTIVVQ